MMTAQTRQQVHRSSAGTAEEQGRRKRRAVPIQFANGWLEQLDERTTLSRTMLARYRVLTDDLGGLDSLSYAQRSLCERALWLEYWMAQQERALAEGAEFEVGRWTQAVNALQGIYTKLGLARRDAEPVDLSTWLRNREGEEAAP